MNILLTRSNGLDHLHINDVMLKNIQSQGYAKCDRKSTWRMKHRCYILLNVVFLYCSTEFILLFFLYKSCLQNIDAYKHCLIKALL